jgi:hypothetical protein
VAFIVMRVLIRARVLWARGGAVPIDALPALVAASPYAVSVALDRLCEEGIAELRTGEGTVCLTDRAAAEFLARGDRPAPLWGGTPAAA